MVKTAVNTSHRLSSPTKFRSPKKTNKNASPVRQNIHKSYNTNYCRPVDQESIEGILLHNLHKRRSVSSFTTPSQNIKTITVTRKGKWFTVLLRENLKGQPYSLVIACIGRLRNPFFRQVQNDYELMHFLCMVEILGNDPCLINRSRLKIIPRCRYT